MRKLEYVRRIKKRKITRGQLKLMEEAIQEIAKEIEDPKPPSYMTVTAWMRKLERANGDIYVLVSGHARSGTRQRQPAEHEALISNVIDAHYMTRDMLTATTVYDDKYLTALKKLNAERVAAKEPEFEAISERSFYRRIDRIDEFEVTAARLGTEEARRTHRMSKGHNSPCWRIGPEWITKRNFISSRSLACCPECLQNDPYLPGIWELVFYRTCAIHRTTLVDQCPGCGKPLRWTRRGVCFCSCGFDLRDAPSRPGSEASWMLAQLIERRLYPDFDLTVPGQMPFHVVERLASLTLDGLFKTIWFLGHCVAEFDTCAIGHGRVQLKGGRAEQVIENAFSLLADWSQALAERLAVIAARPNENKKASFYRNVLGPVATYMDEEITGEELVFLRSTYEYHIRRIWHELGRKPLQGFDERQLELDFS